MFVKESGRVVKENVRRRESLSPWWVGALAALSAAALLLAARLDAALPPPRDRAHAKPTEFVAQNAYDVLLNLTSIGPRVAGSYENEVLGVGAVTAAVRWAAEAARAASPHNTVQMQVHTASGAFPLAFFDGMTNVYRDVQSVVARVSGVGARRRRPALLLNCHFDTVPGSPGASDDGAGCAVLAETLRALAAAPRPLRHDAVFLFNGAEENIMQASHAFVTTHEWAKSVRAFINIEACGAGGREVLFQAGPYDPWIMETYASVVPRPFASSLAQELFESGVIPADTDFRIFRDFGNLSGVDLAWSSNGYVYHTHLDTAERVPLASLQRTGDNVLALAHGLLESERLAAPVEVARQPVFFDVLGQTLVCARPPLAAAAAALAVLLTLLRLRDSALSAKRRMLVRGYAWAGAVCACALRLCAGAAAGAGAAAAIALLLHSAGARLAFYARPQLLAPLYALPAVCVSWAVSRRLCARAGVAAALRGAGGAARAAGDALAAGCALLLLLAELRRLRSAFVPLQWALALGLADRAAALTKAGERGRLAWWCAGAALPALQTWSLALSSLGMFVPLAGRCGSARLPPDVSLALLASLLTLAATAWLLPVVLAARHVSRIIAVLAAISLVTVLAVLLTELGAPYSAERPQRYMVFHTRRTEHPPPPVSAAPIDPDDPDDTDTAPAAPNVTDIYWLPHLDPNTPHSLLPYVPEVGAAAASSAAECAAWPYCGAPYYLPVGGLVSRGYSLPAPPPPAAAATAVTARLHTVNDTARELQLDIVGPSHVVVIVSPAAGVRVSWLSALGAPPPRGLRWGARDTHFISLTDARAPRPWRLAAHLTLAQGHPPPPAAWAALSVAGHAMDARPAGPLAELLARFPAWTAPVGWCVDLHLLTV